MRSILTIGLVLTLAGVPAVQAQQAAIPLRAEQPAPRVVEASMPTHRVDLTPIHAAAVEPTREAVTPAAARELSATSLLAIVGGLVLVVALVALVR